MKSKFPDDCAEIPTEEEKVRKPKRLMTIPEQTIDLLKPTESEPLFEHRLCR